MHQKKKKSGYTQKSKLDMAATYPNQDANNVIKSLNV